MGAIAAGVGAVGSIAGAAMQSGAATSAANVQAQAAEQATALQSQMFQQTQANLRPFMTGGTNALTQLQSLTGTNAAAPGVSPAAPSWASSGAAATSADVQNAWQTLLGRSADMSQPGSSNWIGQPLSALYQGLTSSQEYQNRLAAGAVPGQTQPTAAGNPLTAPLTAPFASTPGAQMSALAQTPGYQFTLQQGQLATQNSFAAQGLSASGAAVKGAAQYAEGLASTTYQQQFQNYLNQNQQIYNMLYNQTSMGESAAATAGSQAIQGSANIANTLTSGAAATAGGIMGSANAISGGLGNLNTMAYLYNQGGLFGGSGGQSPGGSNIGSWFSGWSGAQPGTIQGGEVV